MFSQLTRSIIATALVLSLLGGTLAAAAPRQEQQTQPPPAAQTTPDKKTAPTNQKQATTVASNDSHRPLSTDEDPSMIGKRNINHGIGIFTGGGSLEKEVSLGRELAAQVDREAKFVDDPLITEYVNRVGQNIVLHSDSKVPFTIKVIDSDEVNAFALPGGFFYVNKGLILAADNEAEVAGVMAHEIAHVAARHAVENMRKGQWIEGLAMVGSIFTGGIAGMVYQNLAGFGLLAVFLKFSRGAESEADRLGVQYMYAAGYDPGAMSTMFEKLASQNKKKPGFLSKAFSTHPQSVDRLEAARALVARFPEREEYVLSTSEFQRVKARLLRLSNAKASTTGSLADDNGQPKRPTLKRRQPTPDDPNASSTSGDQQPNTQQQEPPKLKRREQTPTPQTTPPPDNEQQ